MLIESTLFGEIDRVRKAVALLREREPGDGYYVAYSGGKDSEVILHLVQRAGVKYDAHYNCTTIDPPEIYSFIRKHHPGIQWHYPKRPFLRELPDRGFPMRQRRWCCEYLKETTGVNRIVVTGIRRAESRSRAMRKMIEGDQENRVRGFIHPIFSWNTTDVWEYIHKNELPYCVLYDEGWTRIGCLLCPFASTDRRIAEAERYPRVTRAYIKAFNKLYENRRARGMTSVERWGDGEEMFWWWLTGREKTKIELWEE